MDSSQQVLSTWGCSLSFFPSESDEARVALISGSGYWKGRLSGRWDDVEPDESYFVDADPALFEDILNFLRTAGPPPSTSTRGNKTLTAASILFYQARRASFWSTP